MQPTADFWGELFGPNWTAQGVAATISSAIALVAVGISSIVSWVQGSKTRSHVDAVNEKQETREREFKGREHWWERFEWACAEVASGDETRAGVGLIILSDLSVSTWANASDKLLIASVLDELFIEDSDEGEGIEDEASTEGE
ncbi:hypothetical protein [Arthrobacter sp. S2(2024)]|uniref:hypothetical protein n=1 Tax=Arthrobacter sp. S2(2024) TaxID=3111911 RepID=UPI002FCB4B7E